MNEKPIILFDGVCNLCNGAINFVIDHDKKEVFRFASLQSGFGQNVLLKFGKSITDFDSMLVLDNDNIYQKAEAALFMAKKLDKPWRYLSFFRIFPTWFLNIFYNIIAKNRYRLFGKSETCRIPTMALMDRFIEE
jgi:predicted DCC family thiol-disulfide oxidoreductase YuxK